MVSLLGLIIPPKISVATAAQRTRFFFCNPFVCLLVRVGARPLASHLQMMGERKKTAEANELVLWLPDLDTSTSVPRNPACH